MSRIKYILVILSDHSQTEFDVKRNFYFLSKFQIQAESHRNLEYFEIRKEDWRMRNGTVRI